MDEDPLDSLLGLEEGYYQEGYQLGEEDGTHAGWVEGKLFGIEKGFEKGLEMGRLHGKATVWKYRLNGNDIVDSSNQTSEMEPSDLANAVHGLPGLVDSGRLATHLDQLISITSTKNLSSANDDDSVSDFDDRLKRAGAKVKIVSRTIGEFDRPSNDKPGQTQGDGSGNIEDLSSLSVRR